MLVYENKNCMVTKILIQGVSRYFVSIKNNGGYMYVFQDKNIAVVACDKLSVEIRDL